MNREIIIEKIKSILSDYDYWKFSDISNKKMMIEYTNKQIGMNMQDNLLTNHHLENINTSRFNALLLEQIEMMNEYQVITNDFASFDYNLKRFIFTIERSFFLSEKNKTLTKLENCANTKDMKDFYNKEFVNKKNNYEILQKALKNETEESYVVQPLELVIKNGEYFVVLKKYDYGFEKPEFEKKYQKNIVKKAFNSKNEKVDKGFLIKDIIPISGLTVLQSENKEAGIYLTEEFAECVSNGREYTSYVYPSIVCKKKTLFIDWDMRSQYLHSKTFYPNSSGYSYFIKQIWSNEKLISFLDDKIYDGYRFFIINGINDIFEFQDVVLKKFVRELNYFAIKNKISILLVADFGKMRKIFGKISVSQLYLNGRSEKCFLKGNNEKTGEFEDEVYFDSSIGFYKEYGDD